MEIEVDKEKYCPIKFIDGRRWFNNLVGCDGNRCMAWIDTPHKQGTEGSCMILDSFKANIKEAK